MHLNDIAKIYDVTTRSVFNWFKEFKNDGILSLKCKTGRGRKPLKGEIDIEYFDESGFNLNPNLSYAWNPIGETLRNQNQIKPSSKRTLLALFKQF